MKSHGSGGGSHANGMAGAAVAAGVDAAAPTDARIDRPTTSDTPVVEPAPGYLFVLEAGRGGALIQRLAGYLLPPGTSCADVEAPPSSAGAFSLDGGGGGAPADGREGN